MLLSGLSRGPSVEKFLSQKARYETKTFTKLFAKYLTKFKKEIGRYFPSPGNDVFAYAIEILSLQMLTGCRLRR